MVLESEHDDERRGTVMVRDPAVEARLTSQSPLPVGEDVTVTLAEADPATRRSASRSRQAAGSRTTNVLP